MFCGVTHGDSAGMAKNSRLGRLGAFSATSAAVCVSPVTIANGRPVRRSKLSAKKRPISAAGCATRRSTANVHGSSSTAITTISGGNSSNIAQVYCVSRWWTMRMRSGASTTTARAVSTTSAGARKFSGRPVNSAARPIVAAGSTARQLTNVRASGSTGARSTSAAAPRGDSVKPRPSSASTTSAMWPIAKAPSNCSQVCAFSTKPAKLTVPSMPVCSIQTRWR